MKRNTYLAALAAAATLAVIGSAHAGHSGDNDALAIANAKINLGQAVATAESYVGGKASRAEYERHKGQGVFEIEVVKGTSVMDVKVNAASGQVINARADKADRED